MQSVASGDFVTPTYNIGSNSVSISLAAANAVRKSKATLAVSGLKGVVVPTAGPEVTVTVRHQR